MRVSAMVLICGVLAFPATALEWQEDFNGGFDQNWDFFSEDGAIPPSHTDAVIIDDALEIRGREADFPDFNFFAVGLVGLTSDPGLAFPDAVQVTATVSPTMNFGPETGIEVPDSSDVFLMARSEGASAYVLALDRFTGSFDLVRSDGGVPTNIAPGMIVPGFDNSASYVLRMTAEGNRIRGEVFDTSMNLLLDAYATDDTYSSGFAGVGAAMSDDVEGFLRTYATGRFDDVLATDENIVPMQPFFPSHRLDMRIPTASGLNAMEIRDPAIGDFESVRTAIDLLLAAGPADRHEGTIPTFDIHDPDNGANAGAVNSPQQPILTDELLTDDNDFAQLLSGSFEVPAGLGGDYTFNFHTDDGFAMRIFHDGPAAGEDLVPVPFTKLGDRGILTSEGAVAFPHDTGDSNVQAAVNLAEGTYSYEMLWFEASGGAFAEVSTAAGDFVDSPALANWVLLGDANGLALIDGLGTGPMGPVNGIEGDFNGNGLVEQQDLDLVLGNWGKTASQVPATWTDDLPEGNVDQNELDKVLANWGTRSELGHAAGVPEPATAVLLILGLLPFIAWRARGR